MATGVTSMRSFWISCCRVEMAWAFFESCGRWLAKPILILSARDSVDDRVEGLDAGANDYLVKPFAFAEFLARLRCFCVAISRPEPWC